MKAYHERLRHKDGRPYMRRWVAVLPGGWSVRLHLFESSDGPDPHDHPWPFVGVALWGVGEEETWRTDSAGRWRRSRRAILPLVPRFYSPYAVHRVIGPRRLLTVVVTGRRARTWGFWIDDRGGWRRWVRHSEHRR